MLWFWLAALAIFLIAEACTSALLSIWFVGGSVAALIATACGAQLWLQIVLFVIVSAALLLALRPFAKKFLAPKNIATNARSNIGKLAVVTEKVDNLNGTGAVKIAGIFWSARSANNQIIEQGTVVRIVDLEGAKVCVESAEERSEVIV